MPTAFVLMPFSNEFDEIYTHFILKALESADFNVNRADSIDGQQNILKDIVSGISKGDLIVADLTTSNPNVYYELGLAHALRKKTILICQDLEEIPFDLRSYRVLPYSTHFAEIENSKTKLTELARASCEANAPFGNPVSDFNKDNLVQPEDSLDLQQDELGILDFFTSYEDCMIELTSIVENLSADLITYTVEINETTAKLNRVNSPSQNRSLVISLTEQQNIFIEKLINYNTNYEKQISLATFNIDQLSLQLDPDTIEDKELIIKSLTEFANGVADTKTKIVDFYKTVQNTPPIEKGFNRSKKELERELAKLIDNLKQTLAFASRFKSIFIP